jgi:hypothetical protein
LVNILFYVILLLPYQRNIVDKVWQKVMRCLHFNFNTPPNLYVHWCVGRKLRKDLRLILHVVLWVMWRARNEAIFKNQTREVVKIVDEIKVHFKVNYSRDNTAISLCV